MFLPRGQNVIRNSVSPYAAAIFVYIYINTYTNEHGRIFLYTAGGKVKWTTIEAEVDGRKNGGKVGREMTVSVSGSWATRFISTSTDGFIHVHSRPQAL